MDTKTGKPINTSVPTIKFNASAEELEEVYYGSDEDKSTTSIDQGSSPKHAGNITEVATNDESTTTTAAPVVPSDPWRFFSGIRGKITKSVEGKLTEYKSGKSSENEVSPKHAATKSGGKDTKDSCTTNNSRSDSEDISESSISRTCGGLSTTEGVELSTDYDDSDDQTPSLSDGGGVSFGPSNSSGLRYRFRLARNARNAIRNKPEISTNNDTVPSNNDKATSNNDKATSSNDKATSNKDKGTTSSSGSIDRGSISSGTVGDSFIRALHRISTGNTESAASATSGGKRRLVTEEEEEVLSCTEEGVDVLEVGGGGVLPPIDLNIQNMTIEDDDVINIRVVTGTEIRQSHLQSGYTEGATTPTVFSPSKFVDLRSIYCRPSKCAVTGGVTTTNPTTWAGRKSSYGIIAAALFLFLYTVLPLGVYLSGYILGVVSTLALVALYGRVVAPLRDAVKVDKTALTVQECDVGSSNALITSVVKEHRAPIRHEVWMNEWPEIYNPRSYSVASTQSVYLRLQGQLLRVSNTSTRIAKRALYDENTPPTPHFTRHRIYNLQGAVVTLLPQGLTYIRHWSKKYPICITLNKNQVNYDYLEKKKRNKEKAKKKKFVKTPSDVKKGKMQNKIICQSQLFSKLSQLDSEDALSNAETKSNDTGELLLDSADKQELEDKEEDEDMEDGTSNVDVPLEETEEDTMLYLFARTCRDKEHWFQLLTNATKIEEDQKNSMTALDQYYSYMKKFMQSDIMETSPTDTPDTSATLTTSHREDLPKSQPLSPVKKPSIFSKSAPTIANTSETTTTTASPSNTTDPLLPLTTSTITPDLVWLNTLIARVFYEFSREAAFTTRLKERIQRKLATVRLPYFIEELRLTELNIGREPPVLQKTGRPLLDGRGLWVDVDVSYAGKLVLILQTKVNLMRLKKKEDQKDSGSMTGITLTNTSDHAEDSTDPTTHLSSTTPQSPSHPSLHTTKSAIFHSDVDDSAESSSDDDDNTTTTTVPPSILSTVNSTGTAATTTTSSTDSVTGTGQGLAEGEEGGGGVVSSQGTVTAPSKKLIRMVDRIAESRIFRAASEYRYVRRALEGVSNTELSLRVEVCALSGRLALNIPTPPTDRIWLGFHPMPHLSVHALPIVGELNISLHHITSWLEKRLCREFHKLLVLPNMEDLVIPVGSR